MSVELELLKQNAEKRIKELEAENNEICASCEDRLCDTVGGCVDTNLKCNDEELEICKDQHEKSTAYGVAFAIDAMLGVQRYECWIKCSDLEAIAERILSEIKSKKGEQ